MKTANEVRILVDEARTNLEANKIIEEYAEQFKPKWISVNDSLPIHGERCLFVVDSPQSHRHRSVYAGSYTGDPEGTGFRNEFSTPGIGFNASHWMLSPEPPKL